MKKSHAHYALHEALMAALGTDNLGEEVCLPGVTWTKGGCFGLALVLHDWSRGQARPVGVYRLDSVIMDHITVQVSFDGKKPLYLDGDGVSSRREMIARWKDDYGIGPCRLKPVTSDHMRGAFNADLVVDADLLLAHIRNALGDFHDWVPHPLQLTSVSP